MKYKFFFSLFVTIIFNAQCSVQHNENNIIYLKNYFLEEAKTGGTPLQKLYSDEIFFNNIKKSYEWIMENILLNTIPINYTYDPKAYCEILKQKLLENNDNIKKLNMSINILESSQDSIYNAIKQIIHSTPEILKHQYNTEICSQYISEIVNLIAMNNQNKEAELNKKTEFFNNIIIFNSFVNQEYAEQKKIIDSFLL